MVVGFFLLISDLYKSILRAHIPKNRLLKYSSRSQYLKFWVLARILYESRPLDIIFHSTDGFTKVFHSYVLTPS